MDQVYAAEVLLERPWHFDMADFAAKLAERFEELGEVRACEIARPGAAPVSGIEIEGAEVPILLQEARAEIAPPDPGLTPVRAWDPEPAAATHKAHLSVNCRVPGQGLVWAKACATVTTLVAGALAKLGPSMAVHYPASGAILAPEEAYLAARTALRGVSPIEAWVSFYAFAPDPPLGRDPEPHGALTRGLLPFIGREIALAPRPVAPRQAVDGAHGAAWAALDGEEPIAEGMTLPEPLGLHGVAVRAAEEWGRPGVPVFVLVADDSPVDPRTLALRRPVEARLGEALAAARIPGKAELRAAAGAVPGALKRQGAKLASAAAPVLGQGARRAGRELGRSPEHAATAFRAARKLGGLAARQAQTGLAAGKRYLAERREKAARESGEG